MNIYSVGIVRIFGLFLSRNHSRRTRDADTAGCVRMRSPLFISRIMVFTLKSVLCRFAKVAIAVLLVAMLLVGLTATWRPDTVYANCADLNSLSIAITKQQEKTGIGRECYFFT